MPFGYNACSVFVHDKLFIIILFEGLICARQRYQTWWEDMKTPFKTICAVHAWLKRLIFKSLADHSYSNDSYMFAYVISLTCTPLQTALVWSEESTVVNVVSKSVHRFRCKNTYLTIVYKFSWGFFCVFLIHSSYIFIYILGSLSASLIAIEIHMEGY